MIDDTPETDKVWDSLLLGELEWHSVAHNIYLKCKTMERKRDKWRESAEAFNSGNSDLGIKCLEEAKERDGW